MSDSPRDLSDAPARAPRLSPNARREAILELVVPAVVEHGLDLSTRELAQAAEVAEGTLFRVFPDKRALVSAAVHEAARRHFASHDEGHHWPELPLEATLPERLTVLVEQIAARAGKTFRILSLFHELEPNAGPQQRPDPRGSYTEQSRQRRIQLDDEVATFLGPYASQLRIPAGQLVDFTRSIVLGGYLSLRGHGPSFTTDQMVDLLLNGAIRT